MTEDEELRAKIATLTRKIKMRRQESESSPPFGQPYLRGGENYWVPQRGTPYGVPRGRGRHYQPSHRNRTLIINSSESSQLSPAAGTSLAQPDTIAKGADSPGWVKRHDRHDQLINTAVFDRKNQERIQAIQESTKKKQIERNALQKDKVARHFAANQLLDSAEHGNSVAKATTAAQDGVHFEFDIDNIRFRVLDGGSKLTRMDGNPKTARSTPKRTTIGGVLFLRSKNGNLYRSGLVKKKQEKVVKKKADLCPRFTATGYCPHGPKCLYTHDAHKVAICKDFLQTGTCQAGDVCDLSHDPSPNRVPACVHFVRGKCTNDDCRYAHIRVNPGAPVCRAFAALGYCEAGSSCPERHVHECPDYANKGICRKAHCPLPHVDRAGQLRKTAANEERTALSDFSSDEEYDEINSDDVDSDDLDEDVLTPGAEGNNDHELSQQQDFVRF